MEKENAAAGAVETPESQEIDYKAQFEAAMAENARILEERENYRLGMLKAKGKLPQDDAYTPDIDSLVESKVKEVLEKKTFEEQIKANEEKQREILEKIRMENEELKNALKNGGISIPVSGGSNNDKPEAPKKEFFTAEQLADMKRRGVDPEKVRANMAGYHSAPAN